MVIVNLTDPFTTILCVAAIICFIFVGHETKKSVAPAIALGLCIGLLIMHIAQLLSLGENDLAYKIILTGSVMYDFGFILVTYLGYLWIDDEEAKFKNKKNIDNSLNWFWTKV